MRIVRVFAPLGLTLLAAVPAFAAGGEGEESHVFWEVANLLLLIAVVVFLTRRSVTGFLKNRHDQVAENLRASETLLAESEERLAELNRKSANLDDQLVEIRRETAERAEREAEEIIADARETAARIERDAAGAVERELLRARHTLRGEASRLAIELAGERLKSDVTDADRSRLVDEFIARVGDGSDDAVVRETN